jgi:F-type H+-transporting ATPase subunit epsilon
MSESKINFKIVTSEKTVYEDVIDQATFMTTDGQITILPNHRSYITSLESGEAMVRIKGEEVFLSISGGFIEFHNNTLIVLADTAERAEEIDLARAEEARKRAEELKKEAISMDDEDYARVAAAIQKESARIRVAKKHYTKKGINIGQ